MHRRAFVAYEFQPAITVNVNGEDLRAVDRGAGWSGWGIVTIAWPPTEDDVRSAVHQKVLADYRASGEHADLLNIDADDILVTALTWVSPVYEE